MIEKAIKDANYDLKDNPDGTRTIIFGGDFEVTFRCLSYIEYIKLKVDAETQVEAHIKASIKGTEQEKTDILKSLTFQEGNNLWIEILAFKPVDFRKKPSQKS